MCQNAIHMLTGDWIEKHLIDTTAEYKLYECICVFYQAIEWKYFTKLKNENILPS